MDEELEEMLKCILSASNSSDGASSPVVQTGFRELDEALGGGLHPGIYYIAGMPGTGKTSLAAQICSRARRQEGMATSFLELEMGENEIAAKMLQAASVNAGKDSTSWLTQKDFQDTLALAAGKREVLGRVVKEFMEQIDDGGCFLHSIYGPSELYTYAASEWHAFEYPYLQQRGCSPYDLFTDDPDCSHRQNPFYKCARCDLGIYCLSTQDDLKHARITTEDKETGKITKIAKPDGALVVIDSLQTIRDDRYPKDDTGRIVEAVEDLKKLRRESPVPMAILVISTLSRTGYKDPAAFASMAGSSAIEYSAEGILVLTEDEAYKPSPASRERMEQEGIKRMSLAVTKNRHGKSGQSVPLWFDGAHSCFIEPDKKK